jgi:hypothetical protein
LILPEALAREGFKRVIEDLSAAEATGGRRWQVVYAAYPRIGLRIKSGTAAGKVALLLEVPDWPHRPFEVIPIDASFVAPLPVEKMVRKADAAGITHLVVDGTGRAWFCVIGTLSFHRQYKEILPWEEIRHLPANLPHQVVESCLGCLDLDAVWP